MNLYNNMPTEKEWVLVASGKGIKQADLTGYTEIIAMWMVNTADVLTTTWARLPDFSPASGYDCYMVRTYVGGSNASPIVRIYLDTKTVNLDVSQRPSGFGEGIMKLYAR